MHRFYQGSRQRVYLCSRTDADVLSRSFQDGQHGHGAAQREQARVARVWVFHAACVSASQCETQMMGLGVGHRTVKEGPMGMKANEVGDWLRQIAGKRDHHELMPEDYVESMQNRGGD